MTPTTPTTAEPAPPAPTGAPEGFIFQRDTMGRVRVPAARREALLDEFERGGGSAQAFAALVGVRYSTFATWMQDRRRANRAAAAGRLAPAPAAAAPVAGPVRWLEALVADPEAAAAPTPLCVVLPGGARLEITDAAQATLAATLLRALDRRG